MSDRLKCVYIIPNGANFQLQGGSAGGSATHIRIGIEQLKNSFEVVPMVVGGKSSHDTAKSPARKDFTARPVDSRRLVGMMRDLKTLFVNHLRFFKVYRTLARERPDLVYERSEYLNLNGVIAARLLGIPHYYEANWVHYKGIEQFYLSFLNGMARRIEEWMYNNSRTVFFVGNQHQLLRLKKRNWKTIQNGVSAELVQQNALLKNVPGHTLHLCVVASLMKHHRLELFIEALSKVNSPERLSIHLIGMNYDSFLAKIPGSINYKVYGPLTKNELYEVLSTMNLAVISGGPFYSSFMKLFEYAAFKLAVICPALQNLTNIFTEGEICFFDENDADELASKIDHFITDNIDITKFGERLYHKVSSQFTWEEIFSRISTEIAGDLSQHKPKRTIEDCVTN
jgi:glycosyltransferase involved in cell wall biosynthesis